MNWNLYFFIYLFHHIIYFKTFGRFLKMSDVIYAIASTYFSNFYISKICKPFQSEKKINVLLTIHENHDEVKKLTFFVKLYFNIRKLRHFLLRVDASLFFFDFRCCLLIHILLFIQVFRIIAQILISSFFFLYEHR